ncbi:MAG TPA: hypothetical protein VGH79_08250 [Gaiellaceae bacterium]|jgi:hypothetical protein
MMTPEEHRDERVGAALASLPTADDSPTFFDRLDTALRREARTSERHTPPWHRRNLGALALIGAAACLLVGGVAGAAIASSNTTTAAPTNLAFAPASGWNTVSSSWHFPHGLAQRMAWATNVPISPLDSASGQPIHTVKTLPADGIVIWVAAPNWDTPKQNYPDAVLPLQTQNFPAHIGQYEMQPAPSISTYGPYLVTVNGHQLGAYIYFGSNPPTDANLNTAQTELNRLEVPAT